MQSEPYSECFSEFVTRHFPRLASSKINFSALDTAETLPLAYYRVYLRRQTQREKNIYMIVRGVDGNNRAARAARTLSQSCAAQNKNMK